MSIKQIPERKFKAVISNRIYMSRTKDLYDSLVEELTYKLPATRPGGFPEYHCSVTRINNNIITIPTGRTDLIPKDYEIVDKRTYNEVRFPKFKFTLRKAQQEIIDDITDSFIINANPAFGKTFCGIAAAVKLKQKTLIVVHTVFLRTQWEDEIMKCLGIKAGIIGSGKYDIKHPIVVANIQSLKKHTSELSKEFGTIIVDECHHIPASVFKETIDKFHARYKIGLSATLWRKDGKHVMINDYVGKKVYKPVDENALKPTVTIINSGIAFDSDPKIHWAIKVNNLVSNPSYIELILNILEAQAARGHKVLLVSDRTEMLETCNEILENYKLIIGSTEDRTFNDKELDGILGSVKIFSEGINIPALSCLVLGLPINNKALLEQLIGRVNRVSEGKMNPEIIDIGLEGKLAKNQLSARINYYSNKGYKIRYI